MKTANPLTNLYPELINTTPKKYVEFPGIQGNSELVLFVDVENKLAEKNLELLENILEAVGIKLADIGDAELYGPVGCEECNRTGYRGRVGCYELMEMSPEIREAVFKNAPTNRIRELAIQTGGMATLQADGVRKVLEGLTTVEEVLSITHRQDLMMGS